MRPLLTGLLFLVPGLLLAQAPAPASLPASVAAAEAQQPSGRETWPEAIEDNSFLIEEAYNQEPGVVQWIFGGLYTRPAGQWATSFTNEWPVPDEKHQLSYTVAWTRGGAGSPSGFGDLMLNYRYQLRFESAGSAAISPRLSVILPTGDWRSGLGSGTMGWQFNLPVSKRISPHFAMHLNLGGTLSPSARTLDPSGRERREDLRGLNEGASLIWLTSPRLNLMLEGVAYQQDQFSSDGARQRVRQAFISPGVRYAFNLPRGQLVVGAAVPIGLTPASPHSGAFLYLSWEAPVWKAGHSV